MDHLVNNPYYKWCGERGPWKQEGVAEEARLLWSDITAAFNRTVNSGSEDIVISQRALRQAKNNLFWGGIGLGVCWFLALLVRKNVPAALFIGGLGTAAFGGLNVFPGGYVELAHHREQTFRMVEGQTPAAD